MLFANYFCTFVSDLILQLQVKRDVISTQGNSNGSFVSSRRLWSERLKIWSLLLSTVLLNYPRPY